MEKNLRVISLISEEEIQNKVQALARRISEDYQNHEIVAVGILKGAWVFLADLIRKLTLPVICDFLTVSSYGKGTETSGLVQIVTDLKTPIEGKDVLLVEDIIDTGITLNYIRDMLALRHPKSLKVCSLLDKPERHRVDVKIDYLGFTIPNKFVVGYGVDYNEQFRQLPYIGYIEFE
jgi:hypoxanthine phosphoribosyltransferase